MLLMDFTQGLKQGLTKKIKSYKNVLQYMIFHNIRER
jgi:hypothetical protein